MCIGFVSAQVTNVSIVVLLKAIVGHKAPVIAMDVRISSCAIEMVMKSLGWTSTYTTSRNILRSKSSFSWGENASFALLAWRVTNSIAAHVEADVRISTTSVCVIDACLSSFAKNAAHFL